jgi:pimeloyl-ACP methyl ester carboxylesterase
MSSSLEENYTVAVKGKPYPINYRVRLGNDQWVILIHGVGSSKEDFDSVWDRPEFSELSLLALDLPGFGKSAKSSEFSYDLEDHAAVCAAVLEQYNPPSLHIVGHSVGGAIAVLLAEQLQDKLMSLVSVEGNLIAEDCGLVTRETAGVSFEKYEKTLLAARRKRLISQDRDTEAHDQMLPLAFYKTAVSTVKWSDSGSLIKSFQELPGRKLYIYGDQNHHYPVIKKLENVPVISISGSGHHPMLDNPDEFYSKLGDFIKPAG